MDLRWHASDIERADDLQFIYFGIEDANGKVIYRYDAVSDSPEARGSVETKRVSLLSHTKPAKLVVWPVSHSRGWLRRIDYLL